MYLTYHSPIRFDFRPISESIIAFEFKLKASRYNIKVSVDLNIYYKEPYVIGRMSLLNSGMQSVYTSEDDKIHRLKFKTPKFNNYVQSYMYITMEQLAGNPYEKVCIEDIRIEDIRIEDIRIVEMKNMTYSHPNAAMAVPNLRPKIIPPPGPQPILSPPILSPVTNGKKIISFYPFVVKNSGYGILSDNIYKTLLKHNYTVHCNLDHNARSDISLTVSIPPSYFKANAKLNVGYTMFESTKIPDSWIRYCNIMDRIFVPCASNIETFKSCGVEVPIDMIPIGIDTDIYNPDTVKDKYIFYNKSSHVNDAYKFFMINDGQARKNNGMVIEAFNAEFKKEIENDEIFLIIRSYRPYGGENIVYINRFIDDRELPSLINSCDCMISASSGEAGDIPILSGMSMEKPVIVSEGFVHSDYIENGKNGFLIDTEKWIDAFIHPEYRSSIFLSELKGAKWILPNYNNLREKMRYVYENRDIALQIGKNARKYILEHRTLDICTKCMIDIFERYG